MTRGQEWARRMAGVGTEEAPSANGRAAWPVHNLTDLGNAERLVARHGDDLRYCHPWRKWLAWDGKRWSIDVSGEVERRAVETVRAIYAEAENADDADERKLIARHASASESRARIEAMIALARSLPGIPVEPDQLDADPWLFTCANGTLDLRTAELREHRREDLLTKLASVEYDPEATAPRFERFLREILVEEDEIAFVRRFAGYSLTGSTRERVFAILWGKGKNGKSTLVELLRDALGDYAANTDVETILVRKYAGVGNDVAALRGARFVSSAEVEQGRALAESKIKNLTGRDTVTARFLFAEPFDFRPEFKLWLSTNNKPMIYGTDDAIWDRIKLIEFTQRFEGRDADTQLPEKLRAELPGVLAWMVRGCIEWQRGGLRETRRVHDATSAYRDEMDTLAGFIEERCIVRPDVWCKFADLYAAYDEWCRESNETAEKKRRFATMLTERGFVADNGAKNVAIRKGIALRHDGDPDPERVNDRGPRSDPETPDKPPNPGENVNPVNEREQFVNPRNADTYADNANWVNEVNDRSTTFDENPPRKGESWKDVNLVNSLTQEPGGGGDKPSGNPGNPGNPVSLIVSKKKKEEERATKKNRENPVNPVTTVTESVTAPRGEVGEVAALLATPPAWLAAQLDRCREDPERLLNPTATAIAAELYNSPARWREVLPVLEEHLGGGTPAL